LKIDVVESEEEGKRDEEFSGLDAVFHTEACAFDKDYFGVVKKAVEDGGGNRPSKNIRVTRGKVAPKFKSGSNGILLDRQPLVHVAGSVANRWGASKWLGGWHTLQAVRPRRDKVSGQDSL
jgi:hypothetical protein